MLILLILLANSLGIIGTNPPLLAETGLRLGDALLFVLMAYVLLSRTAPVGTTFARFLPLLPFAALFCGSLALSIHRGIPRDVLFSNLRPIVTLFCIYYAIQTLVTKAAEVRRFNHLILGLSAVAALVLLAQVIVGTRFQLLDVGLEYVWGDSSPQKMGRVLPRAFMLNCAGLLFSLAMLWRPERLKTWESAAYGLNVPLQALAIFITLTRSLTIGVLFAVFAGIVLFIKTRRGGMLLVRRSLPLFAVGLVFFAVLSGTAAFSDYAGQFIDRIAETRHYTNFDENSIGRLDEWRIALSWIIDSPLMGIGWAQPYGDLSVVDPFLTPVHVHSLYLSIGMEMGLPGLVAFLWFGLCAMREGYAALRLTSRETGAVALGLLMACVCEAVVGVFSQHALYYPGCIYLGLWMGCLRALRIQVAPLLAPASDKMRALAPRPKVAVQTQSR